MPTTRRRVVCVLCLLAFLAFPLMAMPARESGVPVLGFFSALWERLTGTVSEAATPVAAVWEADATNPEPTPTPIDDGRGGWDPNG